MSDMRKILAIIEKATGRRLRSIWNREVMEVENQGSYSADNAGNIVALNLWNRGIFDISFLQHVPHLTKLNLSSNQISDISFLKYVSKLRQLDLQSNPISDYSYLQHVPNLTQLKLSSNQISDYSFLQRVPDLTQLYLSSNRISELLFLKHVPHLTQLDLSSNQISNILPILHLRALDSLNLSKNKVSRIPEQVMELGPDIIWEEYSREGINLFENPIETPPLEIVKKGREAILAYFKSLEEGARLPLNEVKVLLVGEPGAGKTSLMKRLTGEEFNEDEKQTKGITIRNWSVTENGIEIKIHFWDFGGQLIMHAAHQLFLSKRSLYILVLNGRKEEDAEYWLKHIESFGGDSPILVVLNKIDENPGFEVNRKSLKEKYAGIQGFHRVSCAKGTGIDEFMKAFSSSLTGVKILETLWPQSWFSVKTRLETMPEPFIAYDAYKELCEGEKITDDISRNTLVEFLNDLGNIVHFKDFRLHDTHVLEPRWVTNAIYKIINSPLLAECKGVLKLDCLPEILKKEDEKDKYEYEYPPDKYPYIIDLMLKFDLCYEIDANTILVPDLLDVPEPEFTFPYIDSLKFIFQYDYLPKSIMPRFIVRMHKDIKGELRWRTGVVLEDKSFRSTALIKADERDKKIYIYVNGEQKRDYFATIRKTFKDINGSFEKLEVKELVPLPDKSGITVEYEELLGHWLAGKEEIFSGILRKGFNVSILLDGLEKPEERKSKKLKDEGVNIDIDMDMRGMFAGAGSAHANVKQLTEVKQDVNVTQTVNVEVLMKVELPALQKQFEELKDFLIDKDPKLEGKLKEIGDSLDEVSPGSEKEKLNKPMNKLGRFLKELGDEDSKYSEIIRG